MAALMQKDVNQIQGNTKFHKLIDISQRVSYMCQLAIQIAKKQKLYNSLKSQIHNDITAIIGMDIRYKGQQGIVTQVFTDSTCDLLVLDENGIESGIKDVPLVDLEAYK